MLWTDAVGQTPADLLAYESGVAVVASEQGVSLPDKIALARGDVGAQIQEFLLSSTGIIRAGGRCGLTVTANDRLSRGLFDVVLTAELLRWRALLALARAYQDGYAARLDLRFTSKAGSYLKDASRARLDFFAAGVGMVNLPVAMPAPPNLDWVSGVGEAGRVLVSVTGVNVGGQESSPSGISEISVPGAAAVRVRMAAMPPNAVGWNVYAGASVLTLQNASALGVGESWISPAGGLIEGRMAAGGQVPDYWLSSQHMLRRR